MTRYARQIMVPGVGRDGQSRLADAHVLVIGAGGLGCPVLQYLAGAGVGKITLMDPDRVEEGNLHRQPLYKMSDLGRAKVLAARAQLTLANPDVTIVPVQEALHPQNAAGYALDADVVIDAADSFAVSYILSDTCRYLEKPLISASVLGQAGYVGGFCGAAPSLRAVFPDLPQSAATCATVGVLGPVVGAVGAMQAQMALQVLLHHKPSPLGRLVTLDMQTFRFGGFSFDAAPEPEKPIPFLSLADLRNSDHVIELRDTSERPLPLVERAERLPVSAVSGLVPDPGRRIVFCCSSGLRAWRAAMLLLQVGACEVALLAETACG